MNRLLFWATVSPVLLVGLLAVFTRRVPHPRFVAGSGR